MYVNIIMFCLIMWVVGYIGWFIRFFKFRMGCISKIIMSNDLVFIVG